MPLAATSLARRIADASGSLPELIGPRNPSVFTTDLEEAMEAAERLEAGMVWVRRELGRQGLDAVRRSKIVVIDRKPAIQGWWYPCPDTWFRKGGGRKHV